MMTLLGWVLAISIFLKLIGVVPWGWVMTLFPLWVAIVIGTWNYIIDEKVERRHRHKGW